MPDTKPDHVVAYERATGYRTARPAVSSFNGEGYYLDPDENTHLPKSRNWCVLVNRSWVEIPDPESPEWLADALVGLLAKGITVVFRKGGYNPQMMFDKSDGFSAALVEGLVEVEDVVYYGGSTVNAALCAAVLAAEKAEWNR